MNRSDAIDGLTALGLSTYAARTFVALQKLGVANANEVAQVTEVPRSQVYGATEELEALGLVDVQEGSPKQYRPIEVEKARELLYERLHSTADDAFEYVESVRGQGALDDEGQEAIWTTEGRDSITTRITSLVAGASRRTLYATGESELVEGPVVEALEAAAADGVSVTVASANPAVRSTAAERGLDVIEVEDAAKPGIDVGRVLVVDDDTILLSVLPTADIPHGTESAFWTDGSRFAVVLASLIREQFE